MDKRKALLVFALALALSVWSGSKGTGPLAVWPVAEDLCIGIVGTLGLAFGVAGRAILSVLVPFLGIMRLLIVPLALAALVYLIVQFARRGA